MINSISQRIDEGYQVERTLKYQLIFSTVLMTPVLYYLSLHALPTSFSFNSIEGGNVTNTYAFICTAVGLWSGLVIGYFTEYYTSNAYAPV